MRALIVDDERLARQELKRLIDDLPDDILITIVGEAANAPEARQRIAELEPDVIFLDINMPGETGFELLESLERAPRVIFTTAYDEFALKAFEANALDYLLKPIEPARLLSAVNKMRTALADRPAPDRPADPDAPDAPNTGPLGINDRVFIKDGDRCWFVRLGDVYHIESVGNYARLHFNGENALVHRSLTQLDERLDPKVFFRANRQEIIALPYIERIEPYFSNTLLVYLRGGIRVEVSRRQSQKFKQLMSL
jgi:two-component system LytT family response regulator